MRLEDIIESLNKYIEDYRKKQNIDTSGHLVLQKTIKPHKTFKAYKEIDVNIWFVKNRKRYKVIHHLETTPIIGDKEEKALKEVGIIICELLFTFIHSSLFNKVITGEYDEDRDE